MFKQDFIKYESHLINNFNIVYDLDEKINNEIKRFISCSTTENIIISTVSVVDINYRVGRIASFLYGNEDNNETLCFAKFLIKDNYIDYIIELVFIDKFYYRFDCSIYDSLETVIHDIKKRFLYKNKLFDNIPMDIQIVSNIPSKDEYFVVRIYEQLYKVKDDCIGYMFSELYSENLYYYTNIHEALLYVVLKRLEHI